jgi:predicted MFS family arabinose efflux permease
VSLAIVTDLFPLQMRGRAIGVIQTAFSVSTVLGLPLALLLSTHWGWNTPFFMIVAVCAVVGGLIHTYLRPVDEHLKHHPDRSPLHHLLHTISTPRYIHGFLTTGLLTLGAFMLMPFVSVFSVNNVGLPLEQLPLLYMAAGCVSVVAGPVIGRVSDAIGKLKVFTFGCVLTVVMTLIFTHLHASPPWVLYVVIVFLQVGVFTRNISGSALISALPRPTDRGSYMAISSSLQQLAGGVASMSAGLLLVQAPSGALLHFTIVGYVLLCTTMISLTLMYFIQRRIFDERSSGNAIEPTAPAPQTPGAQAFPPPNQTR